MLWNAEEDASFFLVPTFLNSNNIPGGARARERGGGKISKGPGELDDGEKWGYIYHYLLCRLKVLYKDGFKYTD